MCRYFNSRKPVRRLSYVLGLTKRAATGKTPSKSLVNIIHGPKCKPTLKSAYTFHQSTLMPGQPYKLWELQIMIFASSRTKTVILRKQESWLSAHHSLRNTRETLLGASRDMWNLARGLGTTLQSGASFRGPSTNVNMKLQITIFNTLYLSYQLALLLLSFWGGSQKRILSNVSYNISGN